LFSAVDRTCTAAGARLLKDWLAFPLIDLKSIQARQKKIEFWKADAVRLRGARESLRHLGDLERRIGKLLSSTASARDLLALAESLKIGFTIGSKIDSDLEKFLALQ